MFTMLKRLFSSPERLLSVMTKRDMREEKEDGERILIDEDGSASVNIDSPEVHQDFARHVDALRFAGNKNVGERGAQNRVVEQDILKKYSSE